MYGAVAGPIWRLLRRRPLNEDRQVAVWPATSSAGTVADLVFEFSGTPAADEGSGELVGEWAPNGACCLLTTEGAELWPVYNPRRPGLNAPRR
jgi:hypothetical protein